jgi:hypothetical protein
LSYARTAGVDPNDTANQDDDEDDVVDDAAMPPPPGMTLADMKAAGLVAADAPTAMARVAASVPPGSSSEAPQQQKPKPPKPPGPPPDWAFKKARVEA